MTPLNQCLRCKQALKSQGCSKVESATCPSFCSLGNHALRIGHPHQDDPAWYTDISHLHAAENIDLFNLGAGSEDASQDEVRHLFAKADLELFQPGVVSFLVEDFLECFP